MAVRKKPSYPRDLVGYGRTPPRANWPGGACIAVSFVLNYEEGGERSILHGDRESEVFLHEVPGLAPRKGKRDEQVESVYEYGSRAGFWRLLRMFDSRKLQFTSWAVGMAVERHPEAALAMHQSGHEVASHGWRWFDYQDMGIGEERKHMQLAIKAIEKACGQRPVGWYTGRMSANTRKLVVEEGGFLYDSDSYADDLPYWTTVDGQEHLVIPYTFDNNDMRFATTAGFTTGEDFFRYLRDSFDQLYREGQDGQAKMMSIGLHCRLAGRPGRAAALARFLDYVQKHDRVWIARRVDIARHWRQVHPNSKS
jgi:putative urate catabolism protein